MAGINPPLTSHFVVLAKLNFQNRRTVLTRAYGEVGLRNAAVRWYHHMIYDDRGYEIVAYTLIVVFQLVATIEDYPRT